MRETREGRASGGPRGRAAVTRARVGLCAVLALALALAQAACSSPQYTPPTSDPSIRGRVVGLVRHRTAEAQVTMRVEGNLGEDGGMAAVIVSVPADCKVLRGGRESAELVDAESIHQGDELVVWFDGPAIASCPPEAAAAVVLALDAPPD